MKKVLVIISSILVLAVLFIGCSTDGTSGASEYTISGKVIDSVTGDGVSGAKVGFGTNIMTTDVSGNYSVTVTANEAITGNFYVSKGTDYDFSVYSGINLTPVSDLTYDIKIHPVDNSTYTTHTVSGRVYDNTATEISDFSDVNIEIINENGGRNEFYSSYDSGTGGYSIDIDTFGTDCILFIEVDDGTNPVYNYYINNIDLSAATVSLDLTQPSSGYSTVTVTGVYGDMFMGVMAYSDSISFAQVYGLIDVSTTEDVEIYNPDGKSFFWAAMIGQMDTPAAGDTTVNYAFSTVSAPGAAVTLPVPTLSAPTEAILGTSVSYSAGTLSFTGSADFYSISLVPDEGWVYGNILSPTISVDLPADIVTIITSESDSYTSWDADITPVNTSSNFSLSIDLFLSTQSSNGIIPDIEYAMIWGAAPESVDLIP